MNPPTSFNVHSEVEYGPMFLVTRPSPDSIDQFLAGLHALPLSYDERCATRDVLPPGRTVDHNRIHLGRGDGTWQRAMTALRSWTMFDLGWTELFPAGAPIVTGTNVAVLIHHLGFYSLNGARIVYVVEEPDRFGFAYGTLIEHAESGEERFLVERDATGDVYYDLLAFSRPRHAFAKLGYPIARMLQKRFARDSKLRMLRAVSANP